MLPSFSSSKCTSKASVRKVPSRKEVKSASGAKISCRHSNQEKPLTIVEQHQAESAGRPTMQRSAATSPNNVVLGNSKPSHPQLCSTNYWQRPSSSRVSSPSASRTISVRTRAGLSPLSQNGLISRPPGSVRRISDSSNKSPPISRGGQNTGTNPVNQFAIGIECEMVMKPRTGLQQPISGRELRTQVAINHNFEVDARYPRMEMRDSDEGWSREDENFKEWKLWLEPCVRLEETRRRKLFNWGVELKSPKLRTDHVPDWKSTVKKTWAFIERNYLVSKNKACSTHVHISVVNRATTGRTDQIEKSLQDMKRIAQCAIHFEPALEVLAPEERRGNCFALSNWIDNKNFAQEDATREAAIRRIDRCTTEDELIQLMCPGAQSRNFAFNFWALKKFGTVEYRKGSASLTGNEAVAWASLALYFVQAAVQIEPKSLLTRPADIKELTGFLGNDNLNHLQPLLQGKQLNANQQPKIINNYYSELKTEVLKRILKRDAEKQQKLINNRNQK